MTGRPSRATGPCRPLCGSSGSRTRFGPDDPTGRFVVVGLASANRDPERWGPTADELRLERADAREHVAFGAGIHQCLGAALARLERRLAIGGLVRRFPALALDGDPQWNGRTNLRGLAQLPVRVH